MLGPRYAVWEQRVPAGGSASFGDLAPEITTSGRTVPRSCVSHVICQFASAEMELLSLQITEHGATFSAGCVSGGSEVRGSEHVIIVKERE